MPTTMKGVLRECKVTRADVEEGREEGGRVVIIIILPPCFISCDLWPPPYWNVIFLRDLSSGP